jgi:glyoxylase-like metal-dependent hydrolase (beta-lactamase superfamily II)
MRIYQLIHKTLKLASVTALTLAASSALLSTAAQAQVVSVGHYTWAGNGTVNTHWVETPNGVIVIDVQRDLPHAREAIAAIEKIGKPVTAIFVTHGHPDHYAGLSVFRERWPKLDIYASQETASVIKNDSYGFHKMVKPSMGDTFPDSFPEVNKVFLANSEVTIDGAKIVMREMGRAEATSATAYYLPQTKDLFAGDLIMTRMHAFFYEESSSAWLKALNQLGKLFPQAAMIRPGHGEPMAASQAIREQREYILFAKKSLQHELKINTLTTPATKKKVVDSLLTKYPKHGIPSGFPPDMHIPLSVDGLIYEFARESALRGTR